MSAIQRFRCIFFFVLILLENRYLPLNSNHLLGKQRTMLRYRSQPSKIPYLRFGDVFYFLPFESTSLEKLPPGRYLTLITDQRPVTYIYDYKASSKYRTIRWWDGEFHYHLIHTTFITARATLTMHQTPLLEQDVQLSHRNCYIVFNQLSLIQELLENVSNIPKCRMQYMSTSKATILPSN